MGRNETAEGENRPGRGGGSPSGERNGNEMRRPKPAGAASGRASRGGRLREGKRKPVPASSRQNRRRNRGGRQSIQESFIHAFEGILIGLEERNMQIHCVFTGLVVLFGILLRISATEWCICLALFGLVIGLELVNTAIEAVVDLVTDEFRPLAKRAKDAAAGAVLAAAAMAAAAGLIIFLPRLLYFFRNM